MSKEFPYNSGDSVNIYEDWQNELNPLGAVRLVRKYKPGCTFILTEMLPESTQLVYNYETWYVKPEEGHEYLMNIRYLYNIGLSPSMTIEEETEDYSSKMLMDTFIVIHGIEVF